MERVKREPEASSTEPSSAKPGREAYQPPALAWEEEFEPTAASDCFENPERC